tara:strand:+ start:29 stop:655 length:627 start_codon:yes stop_codon:yes gene_type:complete
MSTAEVVHMFNVPMIHYAIEDWRNAKKRITQQLPQITEDMLESNGDVYTDFFDEQFKHCLPPYGETVIDILLPYLKDFTGKTRCEFTDMWFQTAKRGMSHGVHNHGASGWSAILYVDFNYTVHAATRFYSPFRNPWNGNLEDYQPPVREGDLVIFPASIAHEALKNDSDIPRTIISFNLRGKVDYVKHTLWKDEGDPRIVIPRYRDDC